MRAGKLTLLNQDSSGDGPCHLAVNATGHWLAVANYNDGTIVILPIHSDGTLGEPVAVERHRGSGPNRERQEGPHAHSVLFARDNRFLLTADLGLDKGFVYDFDAADGASSVRVRFPQRRAPVPAIAHPIPMAVCFTRSMSSRQHHHGFSLC